MPVQHRRTRVPNLAPTGLMPGQIGVEMASNPVRLWVGVPTTIDPSGRREIRLQSWSTGDVKLTLKDVADPGWIMCNDGTIGSASSGANYANADAEALFKLLFTGVNDTNAPLRTSADAARTRAQENNNPQQAWNNNCRMTLTRMLGRAIAISGAGQGLTNRALGLFTGTENHTLTVNQLARHEHTYEGPYVWAEQSAGGLGWTVALQYSTGPAGNSAGHPNVQPSAFLNAMICL